MNCRQAVDYLVYYNIDINAKDKDGETPLGIAYNKANQYFIKKFNEDFYNFINKESEENRDDKDSDSENNNNNSENKNYYKFFFNNLWGTKSLNMMAFPFLLMVFVLEGINQMIIIKGFNNMYMSLVSFNLFFLFLFFYYVTSKSDAGEIQKNYVNSLLLLVEQKKFKKYMSLVY